MFIPDMRGRWWGKRKNKMENKELKKEKYYQATGRRKRATATVRIFPGQGEVEVNGKPAAEVFPSQIEQTTYQEPFKITETVGKFNVTATIDGGGKGGWLGALVLATSRALVKIEEKNRKILRDAGLLTRDPREKERKKYYLKKARKRPQYSKR
ncbi:MAG: Ribosomal protein S9 [candidate division CPR1 bacterium GW2011_GWC1_49_13]|uniref:Small ribosomal subunit protein uS9 n=1 Tax=candidate division CPR1 bacterium GW2011_GWC1_49_13 TaxID=1618342 RepID=A0A0G1VHS4_9BACT|nr:MAG: Ribosomal protein S9 [candidate division CPR1 bacterium GW2011_GWC1_49_13]